MTYMSGNKQVAVITGGNGGIGKSIARSLLRDGFFVVLADLKNEVADTARDLQNETNGDILGMMADVANFKSTVELFNNIRRETATSSGFPSLPDGILFS